MDFPCIHLVGEGKNPKSLSTVLNKHENKHNAQPLRMLHCRCCMSFMWTESIEKQISVLVSKINDGEGPLFGGGPITPGSNRPTPVCHHKMCIYYSNNVQHAISMMYITSQHASCT